MLKSFLIWALLVTYSSYHKVCRKKPVSQRHGVRSWDKELLSVASIHATDQILSLMSISHSVSFQDNPDCLQVLPLPFLSKILKVYLVVHIMPLNTSNLVNSLNKKKVFFNSKINKNYLFNINLTSNLLIDWIFDFSTEYFTFVSDNDICHCAEWKGHLARAALVDKEECGHSYSSDAQYWTMLNAVKMKASPTKSVLQMQASYLPVTSVLSLHNDNWFWHSLHLPLESLHSSVYDFNNSPVQSKQHIISEMKWKLLFKRQYDCLWALLLQRIITLFCNYIFSKPSVSFAQLIAPQGHGPCGLYLSSYSQKPVQRLTQSGHSINIC